MRLNLRPAHGEQGEKHHHNNRHLAQRAEGWLQMLMLVAIVILAIGMVYGLVTSGSGTPSWMQ